MEVVITNIYLLTVFILTASASLLVLLHRTKVVPLKKNSHIYILNFILVVGIIYIAVSLFGRPLLDKINAYREGILMESEEECKGDNAPYWCHL